MLLVSRRIEYRFGMCFVSLQEGLGIVKVTIGPNKRVFLSCISPTPLSYDNIPRGFHHRKYLEMDPKFAAELGITMDTEVGLAVHCKFGCVCFYANMFSDK